MKTLVVGALLCALAADPTQELSSTQNNAANRAAAQRIKQKQAAPPAKEGQR